MNSSFLKFVLMSASAAFLGLGLNLNAADNAAADTATPGTTQAQDSKTQGNTPPGPTAQNAGTPVASPDSKTGTTMNANHETSVKTASADPATKGVQHRKHKKHGASTGVKKTM